MLQLPGECDPRQLGYGQRHNATASWNRSNDFFCEALWEILCGVKVGERWQKSEIEQIKLIDPDCLIKTLAEDKVEESVACDSTRYSGTCLGTQLRCYNVSELPSGFYWHFAIEKPPWFIGKSTITGPFSYSYVSHYQRAIQSPSCAPCSS